MLRKIRKTWILKISALKKGPQKHQKTLPFDNHNNNIHTIHHTRNSTRSPQWLHLNWKLKHPWLLRPDGRVSHGDGLTRLRGYYRGAANSATWLHKMWETGFSRKNILNSVLRRSYYDHTHRNSSKVLKHARGLRSCVCLELYLPVSIRLH